jgi:chlorophyllide a reductase subunit Y
LAQVINAAIANKPRFEAMSEFFDGVGTGHAAGVWEETPQDRPQFKKKFAAKAARAANAVDAGEAVGV